MSEDQNPPTKNMNITPRSVVVVVSEANAAETVSVLKDVLTYSGTYFASAVDIQLGEVELTPQEQADILVAPVNSIITTLAGKGK